MRTIKDSCISPARRISLCMITIVLASVLFGLMHPCEAARGGETWLPAKAGLGPSGASRTVSSSGLDSTVIEITVPGIFVSDIETAHGVFQLIEIPEEQWLQEDGRPMLPEMIIMVACPEFEDVSADCRVLETAEFDDMLPIPSAKGESRQRRYVRHTDVMGSVDESLYGADAYYPDRVVEILRVGRIRDQKVVWLGIHPVQYNGARKRLVVHSRLTIKLDYLNPAPTLAAWGTGPFESICQRLLLGYSEMHGARSIPILGSGGGEVNWASSLSECISNNTDYLIVAADSFCAEGRPRAAIDSLAQFRARSSGFNVSIINVESIIGDHDSTDPDSLKQFIKDLYDAGTAEHWWDGHLGFVLLAGDHKAPDGSVLIPVHMMESQFGYLPDYPDSNASDNWYAAVGGDSLYPALMIGRITADDTTELWTVVNKIKGYEPLPDTASWSRTVFLTAGTVNPDPEIEPNELEADSISFARIHPIVASAGYDVERLRGDSLCCSGCPDCPDTLAEMNAREINEGKLFVHYLMHGVACEMGWKVPRSFTYCGIDTLLNNSDKLCIFTSMASCMVAYFNYTESCTGCTSEQYDCIGEKLLHMDGGGAVAVVGNTGPSSTDQVGFWDLNFYKSVFEWKVPLLGEAFMEMLLQAHPTHNYHFWVERAVILGDPALRLRYRESGYQKWDLWVRPDTNHIWLEPRIDVSPPPDSTTARAIIRNAAGTALDIPDSLPALAVGFSTQVGEDRVWFIGADSVRTLGAWDSVVVSIRFPVADSLSIGTHELKVEVDPDKVYAGAEATRDNNVGILGFYVGLPPSGGVLPSEPSDYPTLAYLEPSAGCWEHLVLFPCANSYLYVVTGHGFTPGWTFYANDDSLHSPAIHVDQDGDRSQIIPSRHKLWCIDLFSPDSEQVDWVREFDDTISILTPPCIGDFAGDSRLDIAVGVGDTGGYGYVHRIDASNGTDIGSPTCLGDSIPSCPLATVDLNGDGKNDLLAGTDRSGLVAIDGPTGTKLATKRVGPTGPGHTPGPVTAIAVGDLNMDGALEIVAASEDRISVHPADTTLMPLVRKATIGHVKGLAIGDVVDIPDTLAPEIIVCGIHPVHATGSIRVYTWRPDPSVNLQRVLSIGDISATSHPIVGNLSPEPGLEVAFFMSEDGGASAPDTTTLRIWNPNSDQIVGLSDGIVGRVASGVLCDFEDDFEPEIVFASARGDTSSFWVVAGSPCGRRIEWPMALGDERCRGIHALTLQDTLPDGDVDLWGTYLLTGNTWALQNTSLSIEPDTEIRALPDTSSPVSLICKGSLDAKGRADAPIVFTSAAALPKPGDWGRVKLTLSADSMTTVEHCVFEYATEGLHVDASASGKSLAMKSCEFRYNEASGIQLSIPASYPDDTLYVDDCTFMNNSVAGLRLHGGHAQVQNSRFIKNDTLACEEVYAIQAGEDLAGVVIEHNYLNAGSHFYGDTSYCDYGISVTSGLLDSARYVIRYNFIESYRQCGIEIHDIRNPARIDTNCIRSGMESIGACTTLVALKFADYDSGSVCTTLVRHNDIFQSYYGVLAASDPFPVLGDTSDASRHVGLNSFMHNEYYIKSEAGRTLKAEMCYWGADQPDTSLFIGDVDYTPWLSEHTGVEEPAEDKTYSFKLMQSYPNPALIGGATIRFSVARECEATIEVYNVLGQRVRVLYSGRAEPGWHNVFWDTKNENGKAVGPGIYLYRLDTTDFKDTKKVVILR